MTTATLPDVVTPPLRTKRPTSEAMAAVIQQLPADGCAYFDPVDWAEYVQLTDSLFAAGRRIRVLYDRGRLEAMTVGYPHEVWKGVIARFLETVSLATRVRIRNAGGLTIRQQELNRGLEPDVCYYIASLPRVTAIRPLRFPDDPPPDLAIEIEMSQTVIPRLPLYAAFGVPEVWRFDGERLTILRLQPDGSSQESTTSLSFPALPMDLFTSCLSRAATEDETQLCLELFDRIRATRPAPEA